MLIRSHFDYTHRRPKHTRSALILKLCIVPDSPFPPHGLPTAVVRPPELHLDEVLEDLVLHPLLPCRRLQEPDGPLDGIWIVSHVLVVEGGAELVADYKAGGYRVLNCLKEATIEAPIGVYNILPF